MYADNQIDLKVALQKIYEQAMVDGDLGFEYWYKVGQLLRRAAQMQSEMDMLARELEQCRAQLANNRRSLTKSGTRTSRESSKTAVPALLPQAGHKWMEVLTSSIHLERRRFYTDLSVPACYDSKRLRP